MKLALTIAACAATLLGASLVTHAADETTTTSGKRLVSSDAVAKSHPGSFDVYIDEPTGFAYVHTPYGWKFTRKVPDAGIAQGESRPESVVAEL